MSGHVFLVRGDLTKLSCDAWLVPGGNQPRPGTAWANAVAKAGPANTPESWAQAGGRVIPWEPLQEGWPRPWLVHTINFQGAPIDNFIEPARQFLHTVSALAGQKPRNGRACPLVALPVVGAGQGGGARRTGEIVRTLLPELYRFTHHYPIDVALVMKDGAQYAAAQSVRLDRWGDEAWPALDDRLRAKGNHLAYRAARQELVLFLGAGVSQGAGLPSWDGLLQGLAGEELSGDPDFKKLGPLDQARILQRRLPQDIELGKAVAGRLQAAHYSPTHALLASLPVQEVVTTNYDTLFETASESIGRPVEVLPYGVATADSRWVLKLHGCVTRPEDIVLTREDYLRYDTERAALAGIVQALLITRHMLFVGFSLNDDNFHRIADSVRRAVRRQPFGTSLAVSTNRLLRELWETDLNWVEMGDLPQSARLLDIFLDRLAAKTGVTADHFFDPKFEEVLSEGEARLRDELTKLAAFVFSTPTKERRGAAWAEVEKLLSRLGGAQTGRAPDTPEE